MNGYSPRNILLANTAQVIGASVSDTPVSLDTGLTAGGSLYLRVDLIAEDVTKTTGITAKLQHRTFEDSWTDLTSTNASVAITADGE